MVFSLLGLSKHRVCARGTRVSERERFAAMYERVHVHLAPICRQRTMIDSCSHDFFFIAFLLDLG